MSLRRFATRTELTEQLGQSAADFIWKSASPTVDPDTGVESPSVDPVFGGAYVPASGGMEAEVNVTRLISALDAFKAELRKVR